MPPLIFLNRLGMFSSSNGREPHSSAYRMTPQLHTSTSGPEYSFPEMTCVNVCACPRVCAHVCLPVCVFI